MITINDTDSNNDCLYGNITAAEAVDRELIYTEWETCSSPTATTAATATATTTNSNNNYYYYHHYRYLAQQPTTTTTTNNSNKLDKCVEYGHDDP